MNVNEDKLDFKDIKINCKKYEQNLLIREFIYQIFFIIGKNVEMKNTI